MDEVVEIHLPMLDDPPGKYFDLEGAVTNSVEASGLGYVDGNDVGQREFTLFVVGAAGRVLFDAVGPFATG